MTWLLILGLIVCCVVLMSQVSDLTARLGRVEQRLTALAGAPASEPGRAAVAPNAAGTSARAAAVPREPPFQAPEIPTPERPAWLPLGAAGSLGISRSQVRDWLEENGLAWAGGVALALGGLFLVTYAAQQGVFTPPFRIAAAVLAGVVMLAASEWLRRQSGVRGGHLLAAAVAAGAGAATLYGAAWASYWLYAFIPLPLAGALLGLISFGLMGLAFRHGEPLAILAIVGGLLAPMVTGPQQWAAPALTAYLALITATGYAIAGARRWGQAGMATLVGAAVWALAGFTAEGYARATALALTPVALAYGALEWRRRRGESVDPAIRSSFTLMPSAALVTGAGLLLALWFTSMTPAALAAASIGAAIMAGLTAVGAVRRLAPTRLQPLGYGPVVAAALPFLRDLGAADAREAWAGGLMLAAAAAGFWSALGGRTPSARLSASAGGVAAFLLVLVERGPITASAPWAPAAALAVVLVAFAAVLARRSGTPGKDLALAVWIWTAGAAALYALTQAIEPRVLPIAAAALSTVAAALHLRLGWRGFAAVSIAAALGALSALLRTEVFDALRGGDLRWWSLAGVAGASAALVYAGAWMAGRGGRPREPAEALSTGALLIGLTGTFLILRQQGMAGALGGGALDPYFEASLRSVLILAAGLMSAQAARADASLIGRWRGQVLLLAGLAHGVAFELLLRNPLILDWKPRVAGPRIFDSLAVGFLAPALLLGAATLRTVAIRRELLAIYAGGAGLFALVWQLMETRRLFQGASLYAGLDLVGRAEACAYAIIVLVAARAILWAGEVAAPRAWRISDLANQVTVVGRFGAWAALAFALLVFTLLASPWWGPVDRPIAGHRAAALLFAGYATGALATYSLIGAGERMTDRLLPQAARLSVVIIAFALLNLLIRYAFHGLDMRPHLQEMSTTLWAFSAAWGVFGFGLLVYGVARRSNELRGAGLCVLIATTAKIFLFDMARLEGFVRAGSFLAVGALLLAAAILARRLDGSAALPFGVRERRPPEPNEA